MIKTIRENETIIVLIFLICVSGLASVYYFSHGQQLLYGDALSRLNISRKVFDNLTPGLAQLGNVWLPLPQILMFPFIWNSFLWHTGIAGALVSMSAFIIGGIFIYKSAKILTNNIFASFVGLCIYAFNINVIYLQTTAMSESVFLCTLSATIYFFLKWIKTQNKMYLIPSALAVSAMTLTRYEGFSILFSSILLVFVTKFIQQRKIAEAEGQTVLYAMLALTGFTAWTIYLTAIFGDPLYWLHYYASPAASGVGTTVVKSYLQNKNFFAATWEYFTSEVWMIGLFPMLFAFVGLVITGYQSIKNRTLLYFPIFLSLSIFLFMILTLQRNTPINQPSLNSASLSSPTTSSFPEFNIRYGILLLPIVAILTSLVANIRLASVKVILVLLFFVQVYTYFRPEFSIIYQIPLSIANNNTQGTPQEKAMVQWLKSHYDHGLIMISALKHDPQMLQLGYNYKTYIHEGTGYYWKSSIKYPERYATWVVFDSYDKEDQVTKYLSKSKYLSIFYNLVYNQDGIKIYRIKTKPELTS